LEVNFKKLRIMTRYTNTNITNDSKTTSIERLDLLAYKFYGDSALWYVIASANSLGKGSLIVPINSLLRIPDMTNIQTQIQTVNTSR